MEAANFNTAGIIAVGQELINLKTEIKAKDELLRRCKKTFEPFPIVSDLRSMTKMLKEKHDVKEAEAIKKMFKEEDLKYRKLYADIDQALKEGEK